MKFLGWIDHDAQHEEAILKALGANKGHDARDELGLGTIRDSFADLFFPGISTIQQRLRYFLFVQWCCEHAAARGDAESILGRLRAAEEALIRSLRHLGEGQGVIGIQSQEDLARMPSEIYWTGLQVLGLRKVAGSRRRWARQIAQKRAASRLDGRMEEGVRTTPELGFDADRPEAPDKFPDVFELNFDLKIEEAEFLRGRLSGACIDLAGRGHQYNLFAPFSAYRRIVKAETLWSHPRVGSLKPDALDLVMLGGAFASVMHGAVILYNVCVAKLMAADDIGDRRFEIHVGRFRNWAAELNPADVDLLERRLSDLGPLGLLTRHRVDDKTIAFVRRWTTLCRNPTNLVDDPVACRLVSDREVSLKGASGTSRIRSSKQRQRWSGESGTRMDYRWQTAKVYLNDLARARV